MAQGFSKKNIQPLIDNVITNKAMPISSILPWPSDINIPYSWLACDGSALNRILYAELYTVIGTTWGIGDGINTFNLPDFRGGFLRGTGTHGTATKVNGTYFSGPTTGSFATDAIHEHYHQIKRDATSQLLTHDGNQVANANRINLNPTVVNYSGNGGSLPYDAIAFKARELMDTATGAGLARESNETRPFNIGIKYIIKVLNTAEYALQTYPINNDDSFDTATATSLATGLSTKNYIASRVDNQIIKQNSIINGNFDIWQRGTTFTITGSATPYTADRWWGYSSTGDQVTISQVTTNLDINSKYALSIKALNTTSRNLSLFQPLEYDNVIPLQGKTVTFSIRYKNILNATGFWYLAANYSTVESEKNPPTTIAAQPIANFSSWATASFTFTVPSTAKSLSLTINTYNNIVANAEIHICKAVLNEGSTAIPFIRAGKDIGNEFALCQRYYELGKSFMGSSANPTATWSFATYKVNKRINIAPSITVDTSYSGGAAGTTYFNPKYWEYGFLVHNPTNANLGCTWITDAELT